MPDLGRPIINNQLQRVGDLVNTALVTVSSSAEQALPATSTNPDLLFSGPFLRPSQAIGSSVVGLGSGLSAALNPQTAITNSGLPFLSGPLITSTVNTAVGTAMSTFDTNVLEPLDQTLGLRVAGADVMNPPDVLCDVPVLVQ